MSETRTSIAIAEASIAHSVPCRICGAPAGEGCSTRHRDELTRAGRAWGLYLVVPHSERYVDADAHVKAVPTGAPLSAVKLSHRIEIDLTAEEYDRLQDAAGNLSVADHICAVISKPPDLHPADLALDRAAERLVLMLHIYRGHAIGSHGPGGCIMHELEQIAPDIAARVRSHGADETYEALWDENGARK